MKSSTSRSNPKRQNQLKKTISQSTSHLHRPKAQQFFKIIESFHNTLCCVPLDRLVQSQHPQKWLSQQFNTHHHLKAKLDTFQNQKEYQYHLAKLDSVGIILRNFQENLEMLGKIKQQIRYCSSNSSGVQSQRQSNAHTKQIKFLKNRQQAFETKNYDKNTKPNEYQKIFLSSQQDSSQDKTFIQQNSNLRDIANGLLSFDQYQITSKSQINSHKNSRDMCQQKQNIQVNGNFDFDRKKASTYETEAATIQNLCQTQMKKYHQSIKNLLTKRNNKLNSQERQQIPTLQKNEFKMHAKNDKSLEFASNQQFQNQRYKKTTRNRVKRQKFQEYSDQESSDYVPSNLSRNVQKQAQKMRKQIKQKDQEAQSLQQRLKITLQENKELKSSINEKNKVIQQMLINQQSHSQLVQHLKQKLKDKVMESQFFAERIRILQTSSRNVDIYLSQHKSKQQDLMSLAKHQNQRNKKLEKELECVTNKFNSKLQEISIMLKQREKIVQELAKVQKQLKVEREKCEIYRQKYYQSLNKQKQSKSQHQKQLMDVINTHRSQIDRLR